jgi:adenosylcobyric acid synthase
VTLSGQVGMDYRAFKETQYDKLADTLRQYLDMDYVYSILREAVIQ